MEKSSVALFLWDIPAHLWRRGCDAGTAKWILVLTVGMLVLTLLVLPMAATCLSVITWLGEGMWSGQIRQWLYTLHPATCGLVFSLALMATARSLYPLSTHLLDGSICEKFAATVTGETCLAVEGSLMTGAWFYAIQSLLLEIFIVLTLRWG
jgi:hypothetical protein